MAKYAIMPEEDFKDACVAIRERTGGSEKIKSGEMGDKIRAFGSSIIDRSIYQIGDSYTKIIGQYAFYGCKNLMLASFSVATGIGLHAFDGCSSLLRAWFPLAETIGTHAFYGCIRLTSAIFPKVTKINQQAFYNCTALTETSFGAVTSIDYYAFYGCALLEKVDFPVLASIGMYAFRNCLSLKTLILRNTTAACALKNDGALDGSPIANGAGYVYVPAAMLAAYQADSAWSSAGVQFRTIEDYPAICG